MDKEEIRQIIREELIEIMQVNLVDRFLLQKDLEMHDGTNLRIGSRVGTTIGTRTTDKVGFHGAKTAQGATVSDASDLSTAITAINAIIDRLQDKGLIA